MASQAKKIAVVTTCRADWGSTGMVVKALRALPDEFDVTVVAIAANGEALNQLTNAMLSDFPNSDGIGAPQDVIMRSLDLSRMEAPNMAIAAGYATRLAAEAFWQLKPDLVIVSGDRWEMLAVTMAAVMARMHIAHIAGGDLTAGSMDGYFRMAISHLVQWHFVTNMQSLDVLVNGKTIPGGHVFMTGSPAIDRCVDLKYGSVQEIADSVDAGSDRIIVVNWQAESNNPHPNGGLEAILRALKLCEKFNVTKERVTLVPITANPEIHSDEIAKIFAGFGCRELMSFLPSEYLRLLAVCDLLIGNSSSAYYEGSFFGTPAIDVGDRQYGRVRPKSLVRCSDDVSEIAHHIARVLKGDRCEVVDYPYGAGNACGKIVDALRIISRLI